MLDPTHDLSSTVQNFLQRTGFWAAQIDPDDITALEAAGIPPAGAAGQYFLRVGGATTAGRMYEIDNICWAVRHSNFARDVEATRRMLGRTDWIPISSWEGDGGFFYDPVRDHVALITAGPALKAAMNGTFDPQWTSFNAFLEWYFELEPGSADPNSGSPKSAR